MKSAKNTAPAMTAADASGVPGQSMGQIAKDIAAQADAPRSALSLINATTRGVLVLFPYSPKEREEGKVYPVMKGNLDTAAARVLVSAFEHMTDEGRKYLSLSIGSAGENHIGGVIFRKESQNPLDGLWEIAPGKENDRFGAISKTVPGAEPGTYDEVYRLRCSGKRKLSSTGVPFIRCDVYPDRNDRAETLASMDVCF